MNGKHILFYILVTFGHGVGSANSISAMGEAVDLDLVASNVDRDLISFVHQMDKRVECNLKLRAGTWNVSVTKYSMCIFSKYNQGYSETIDHQNFTNC